MVMHLLSDRGADLELTHYSWRRVLRLASRFGWDPGGMDWFSRAGQHVPARVASALADALERALPDVPGHDAMQQLRCELGRLPDLVWFSGPRRELLRDFLRFCRRGGFRIA